MASEPVATESHVGGLSVKAARDVLIKNNGHVGVLTQSVVPDSDHKNTSKSEETTKSKGDVDADVGEDDDCKEKSEATGSDDHTRSDNNSSQNARTSVFDLAAASSSYMDDSLTKSHDPHSLYGSFTWKVPNFKDVSKRELKSSSFSVGPYKWYILVYPNGCDVSNHLSLFLCVADYDKLLPGWSHFAQFTIAVVNKDPKKSKYSDTLHRFCKKEHDWGWKKFMELGKMQDGFVVSDTLVIKVQVQVIKDRQIAPFRTLDSHYRKELIRVYLSNIEGIVRRSVEKTKDLVAQLLERGVEDFWSGLSEKEKEKLSSTPSGPLLKSFTRVFFNEKEVTSTLMMDAAYCAMKVLDLNHKRKFEGLAWNSAEPDSPSSSTFEEYIDSLDSNIYLCESKNAFIFKQDALEMLESFISAPFCVYPFDMNSNDGSKSENENESLESKELKLAAERDELKLIDLARLTMEVFAMAQIAEQNIDKAWKEAEIIRRQEELIREEEEAHKDEAVRLAAKAEAERERKARKKERQRAKKEAERIKQEALEAAKAKEEEMKKVEQEKKRLEAEEKRKQEEAKREAERQRVLEMKQAALAAKKVAKAKARSTDDAEKAITSTQDDTDSLEDSSGINSARSDQSSIKCASKTSKVAMTPQEVMQAEDSSRSSGSTQDNIVAEMRLLLQKRDDEITVLKDKIKSLEGELEMAMARLNSAATNSSTSTPSQSTTGRMQSVEDSSAPSLQSSPILQQQQQQQSAVTSHTYIMQQMASASKQTDPILAGTVSHRVPHASNGMKSSSSHPDVANIMNTSRAGVSYRVGTQNATQASRSPIHPAQSRQHMGRGSNQYTAGYNNGNTVMSASKVVGYGQYSQQSGTSGPQISRPAMNTSTRISPKMNSRAYRTSNDVLGSTMNPEDGTGQSNRHGGEGSGLDDFAHLGLITDLLE